MVKCLPTIRETRVQFLGQEDLLEKEMATYSSIFAWKIPWTEEPGRLQSTGSRRVGHDWATSLVGYWGLRRTPLPQFPVLRKVHPEKTAKEPVSSWGSPWDPLRDSSPCPGTYLITSLRNDSSYNEYVYQPRPQSAGRWLSADRSVTRYAGRLQSMGLQRLGHDWATSLLLSKASWKCWSSTVSGLGKQVEIWAKKIVSK